MAVLPQPHQIKAFAFELDFERESLKSNIQLIPMRSTQLHLEFPGVFWCSRASLFLQSAPLPTALYTEVYHSLSTD